MYRLKAEKAEVPKTRLRLHPWGVSCLQEPDGKATYPRPNDLLWKAILEDLFEDFFTFFFPRAAAEFDLQRGGFQGYKFRTISCLICV